MADFRRKKKKFGCYDQRLKEAQCNLSVCMCVHCKVLQLFHLCAKSKQKKIMIGPIANLLSTTPK